MFVRLIEILNYLHTNHPTSKKETSPGKRLKRFIVVGIFYLTFPFIRYLLLKFISVLTPDELNQLTAPGEEKNYYGKDNLG